MVNEKFENNHMFCFVHCASYASEHYNKWLHIHSISFMYDFREIPSQKEDIDSSEWHQGPAEGSIIIVFLYICK